MTQVVNVRRLGCASLDLAYVAAGRFDAFWERGLNSWDIAAGALLIREAGGYVTDADGERGFPRHRLDLLRQRGDPSAVAGAAEGGVRARAPLPVLHRGEWLASDAGSTPIRRCGPRSPVRTGEGNHGPLPIPDLTPPRRAFLACQRFARFA